MEMTETSELLPMLRRKIPGPLDITLCEALQSAAVIFCRESTLCRQTIVLHDVQAYQPQVLSTGSEYLNIIKILGINGLIKEQDYCCSHNSVTFMEPQRRAEILCVLAPGLNAGYIPEILSLHAESIVCGAMAELHLMQGKAWYSPELSAYYLRRFTDGYRAAYQQTLYDTPVSGYNEPVRKAEYY